MKKHRRISTLAALVALAAFLGATEAAQAGSLLSGYGGPGQGNQAILGSTLLGGHSGGSGGGSSSGGGEAGPPSGAATLSSAGSGTGAPAGEATHTKPRHAAGHHAAARTRNAAPRTAAPAGPARPAPSPAGVKEASQPLGFSGHDLLLVLLVLAGFAATAILTLRLARPGPLAASTKGMGRGTRVTE